MVADQLPELAAKLSPLMPRYRSPLVAVSCAELPTSNGAPSPIRAISDQQVRLGAGNCALCAGYVAAGVQPGRPAGLSLADVAPT